MSILQCDTYQNSSGVPLFNGANGHIELPPGTAANVPIDFNGTGVLASPPIMGSMEYDGKVFYNTPDLGNRALMPSEFILALTGTNALANQTGAQPIFDGGGGPAGGAITLPVGVYEFECQYALTNMATGTSQTFGFALGGTATKTEAWTALAVKGNNSLNVPVGASMTFNTAANTALTGNSTNSAGSAVCKGIIRITVAGTIIPQVSLGAASAVVVQANSFFKCKPVGASGFVSIGPWA